MRKALIIILFILLIPFNNVYAETVYSEWSTVPSGYPNEEEAIQYGVILPKTWSDYNINPATDPTDIFFQVSRNFGDTTYFATNNTVFTPSNCIIYEVDFGEPKKLVDLCVDVDMYKDGVSGYVSPPLEVYLDSTRVAKQGQKPGADGPENLYAKPNRVGQHLIVYMLKPEYGDYNKAKVINSYFITELIKYSHVIEWYEPTNWRFDTPYQLLGGANAQKPAERKVYRHPINPEISVDQRYIYEDSNIEDIEDLAKAIDYTGEDITERIIITEIEYDDTGRVDKNPDSFDPHISDTIHVTYYVINDLGIEDIKTVKLYILRDGTQVDFNIYDRYISEDYIYTLEENSIWKNSEYEKKLKDAINWLEGK